MDQTQARGGQGEYPTPLQFQTADLETEPDLKADIPEPELPNYEEKTKEELEEEVAYLSQGHLRNLDDIGSRVYWLNKKYRATLKRPGKGVKAFCQRINFDVNHWNYLVRKYTPESEKAAAAEEKAARAAERALKKSSAATADACQKIEKSIYTGALSWAQVQEEIELLLSSETCKIAELEKLGNWIISKIAELEEASGATAGTQ